jgi:hypothetical protein
MEKEMEIDVLSNLIGNNDPKYAKTWGGVVEKNRDMMKANPPQLAAYNEIIAAIESTDKNRQHLFFLEGRSLIIT